ncbi:WD repeat-containing protein 48-like [Artemia franciscana]|uniref:WD repeat-containing protein 48 homolog n=1 Tax=Artemia franciscana TaxID=6661 RepID=A0AA88HIL4_ARTSF|nr:hypothetical protein QYM36_015922 [Artemia franciscana]
MLKTTANSCKKKVQLSFVIRDEQESKHRSGVNALQYDPAIQRLYSAGRDGVIRIWNCKNSTDPYLLSMEHHTDWVNDIILCCNGRFIISGSSDQTVKVWNAQKGFCMSTLRTHKDYVKVLAYAKDREQVASGGLDKNIYLWDVNTLTALTASNNIVTTTNLPGNKDSIYSLAMNQSGTLILSGSSDKIIRIWDPRDCNKKPIKLKGHTDNVRCLLVNKEGTHCLSGSSDGTVRLWSIGQQRYITTLRPHDEGVWTIQANDSFNLVFSAGRDKAVWLSDLNAETSALLCVEQNPVLKLCYLQDDGQLWISTSNSEIHRWPVNMKKMNQELTGDSSLPRSVESAPNFVIAGAPSIRQYQCLSDRRHILTKDSTGNVAMYDILQAKRVCSLGEVNLEEEVKKRSQNIYISPWFSVDLKIGLPLIHLAQDENDCLSAWVSAKDAGLVTEESVDQKVNFGGLLLNALLENWLKRQAREDAIEKELEPGKAANGYFSVPPHTPIIISEVDGRTLYRVLCKDTGGDAESASLQDNLPSWIVETVADRVTPKFIKVSFYLLPHPDLGLRAMKKDRLMANDFIPMRKVMEHVLEKVVSPSDESSFPKQSPTESQAGDRASSALDSENVEDRVQLYCNDQLLSPSADLRSVRHFVWKSSADLVIHYKPIM